MRNFIKTLAVAVVAILFMGGCKSLFTLTNSGETATGTPYELVLVCPQAEWQSELGDTLKSVLKQPVKELMQYEPMFDVMRILPNNFKSLTERHRNIVVVDVNPTHAEPSIVVAYDKTAAPQIYITLKGGDTQSLAKYVSDNRDNIIYVLEKAERDRTVNYSRAYYSQFFRDEIFNKFGMDLPLPDNYKLRTSSDDMILISQEFPMASQGFFIYKYPYEGKESLTPEALMKARNRFASRIPGPAEGSYMSTVDKIPNDEGTDYIPFIPDHRALIIGDRTWIEMVGLWDVENYFMGGPYVSYTTVNKATNEVVTIDCYVYYPKPRKKRNMFRALQHLVYLADFPAQK